MKIRLLSKLAMLSRFGGDAEHRTAVYTQVHEDSSTASTLKAAGRVEFGKKSILPRAARYIYWIICCSAITFAVVITVSGFFLRYFDEQRPRFEALGKSLFNQPIKIGRVSAWWNGVDPVLLFDDVAILSADGTQIVLRIDHIQVAIKLIRSLWKQQWDIDRLTIDGTDLEIRHQQGQVQFNNLLDFQITDPDAERQINSQILQNWLLAQPSLYLKNIRIRWIQDDIKLPLNIVGLRLTNTQQEHVLSGQLDINERGQEGIKFNLTVGGDIANPRLLSAKLYAELDNVQLERWHDVLAPRVNFPQRGTLNGQYWAWWSQGTVQKVQMLAETQNIQWDYQDHHYELPYAYGHVGWRRLNANRIEIGGENILLSFPTHNLPLAHMSLIKTEAETPNDYFTLLLDFVDLQDVANTVHSSGLLSAKNMALLQKVAPSGLIKNAQMIFPAQSSSAVQWQFSADVDHVNFAPLDRVPGLQGLCGHVAWHDNRLDFHVASDQVKLYNEQIFSAPIDLTALTTDISLVRREREWQMNIANLHLGDNNIQFYGDISLTIPEQEAPAINLLASLQITNAGTLVNYLPMPLLNQKLRLWLTDAFVAGSANAVIAWRGAVDEHFPYSNSNDGVFLAEADAAHISLRFDEDWPIATDLTGRLSIREGLLAGDVAAGGRLLDVSLKPVTWSISHIAEKKESVLELKGTAQADTAQASDVIEHSPLNGILHKAIENHALSGDLNLTLQLSIPFQHIEDQSRVLGELVLAHNRYKLPKINDITLENVTGSLYFNEQGLLPSILTASLWDSTVKFNLSTVHAADHASLRGEFAATIPSNRLLTAIAPDLTSYFYGRIPLQVTFYTALTREETTDIDIHSDLSGVGIYLPAPLGKLLPETQDTTLSIRLQNDHLTRLILRYAQSLQGELHLQPDGRYVITDVISPVLDIDRWRTLFNRLNRADSTASIASRITSIDAKILKVLWHGQSFSDVKLQLLRHPTAWTMSLDSPAISGQVVIPDDLSREPLDINLQRLYLTAKNVNADSAPLTPEELVPVKMTINDFRYHHQAIGAITIFLTPAAQRINVDTLKIQSPLLMLDTRGYWITDQQSPKSHFIGTAQTDNLQKLLMEWQYPTSLVANTAKLNFDLTWPGTPEQLALEDLIGDVQLDIGRGVITHLDAATNSKLSLGRLLTALSLENIIKRVTFNFSDDTKGYHFDSLKGAGSFGNGLLQIDTLAMNGIVANVDLAGIVALRDKSYNLQLNVTPQLTSSLPMVAGIVTFNPLVGVATYVVDKLLTREVNKLTTYRYQITGPWDNPDVVAREQKH